jgi:two-component system nitrate/nitrite response regulator NarL
VTRLIDPPDAGPLRVLVAARDPLVGAALAARLGAAPAPDAGPPDVVLWDAGPDPRPDRAPLDALADVAAPTLALVAAEETVEAVWAAGARGALMRDAPPEALAAALFAVARGLVVLDPALAETALALDDGPPLDLAGVEPLTPREREVLALVAQGLPNKLVADRLGVSERTAKFHVGQILQKLGAHSRTEAVMRGVRLGLVVL